MYGGGEGKPKFLLQMFPTSTRRAPGRVLRGQGGQLPERLSPLPSPFSPRTLQQALLAGDCGEDASSSSRLLPGPGRRRGRDVAGGLRAALAPGSGGRRLLGRASRLHAGGRCGAAPCRREQRPGSRSRPAPAAAPRRRGCADEFKGRGRQPRRRRGRRLRSLLHSPGLRASFLTDAGGGGAGGGGRCRR